MQRVSSVSSTPNGFCFWTYIRFPCMLTRRRLRLIVPPCATCGRAAGRPLPLFLSHFRHPISYKRPAQLLHLSRPSQHRKWRQSCFSCLLHISLFLGDITSHRLHPPPLIRMVPSGRKLFCKRSTFVLQSSLECEHTSLGRAQVV